MISKIINGVKTPLADLSKIETVNGVEPENRDITITGHNIKAGDTFGEYTINEVLQNIARPISWDDFENGNPEKGFYFIEELTWKYDGQNWVPPQEKLLTKSDLMQRMIFEVSENQPSFMLPFGINAKDLFYSVEVYDEQMNRLYPKVSRSTNNCVINFVDKIVSPVTVIIMGLFEGIVE